jgi:hypothetical protein
MAIGGSCFRRASPMEKFRAGSRIDYSFTRSSRVKTNAAYGPDSDLYGAMGYVRKSQRQSGLTLSSARAAKKRALLQSSARFLCANA